MNERLRQLRAAFDNLSLRERMLLGATGLLLALATLYVGVVLPLLRAREEAESRVTRAEQQLEVMRRLEREFEDVEQRLSTVEARILSGQRGNLRTKLETLARQAAVKIESMEPQPSPAHDLYRETKVGVELESVTLAQAVNYLHQIESNNQVLSVKSLRIRNRSDKPELLDVTFTVSSFERL